jgi:ribosomal protein L11 methyltransferase
VAGVDHEVESVRATAENAEANGAIVAVERFDLIRGGPAPTAPLVLANLLRPLLLCVARAGFQDGAVPETLIASGLLTHEADEIAAAFARHGLQETDRRSSAEWSALVLRRTA